MLQSIGSTGMGYTDTVVTATAGGIAGKAIYGAIIDEVKKVSVDKQQH